MVLTMKRPKQGEIWLFDPDPVKGREIGKKKRPGLILSNNLLNRGPSELTIIVPLTSKDKKIPSHVKIEPPEGGVKVASYAMCEQIRTISRERLIKKYGASCERSTLQEVRSWILDLLWLEP